VSALRDPSAPPLTFPSDPPQVVDLLLLAGADPTAACAAGIVPRTLAALHGTGAAQPHAARPAAWPRRPPRRCAALRDTGPSARWPLHLIKRSDRRRGRSGHLRAAVTLHACAIGPDAYERSLQPRGGGGRGVSD